MTKLSNDRLVIKLSRARRAPLIGTVFRAPRTAVPRQPEIREYFHSRFFHFVCAESRDESTLSPAILLTTRFPSKEKVKFLIAKYLQISGCSATAGPPTKTRSLKGVQTRSAPLQ